MVKHIDWSEHEKLTTDRPARVVARLRKLAAHMRTVPRKLFDQEVWGERRSCGTVACLAGHACTVFPRKLVLRQHDGTNDFSVRSKNGPSDSVDTVFATALGLDFYASCSLTRGDAAHKTPKAAAVECERLADEIERRAKR